jgi:DNA-binding MarR family transcriptional regulator
VFCYCAEARRVSRLLTARYDAALSPAGLTAAQFETLGVVQALEPCSGRVLAERLAVDKTTLSRNLRSMQDVGWIAATASKGDARQMDYALTAAGKKKLAKAMPLWQQMHDVTATQLGAHAASSRRALERMTSAL